MAGTTVIPIGLPRVDVTIDPALWAAIDKITKRACTVTMTDAYGSNWATVAGGLIPPNTPSTIKTRGNSTSTLPKVPLAMEFNAAAQAYGMPIEKDWVLLADMLDKTLLRNELMLLAGARAGMEWVPRFLKVELYINGAYQGLYTFCEKVERSAGRVNLSSLGSGTADQSEPNVTGGYLLELVPDNRLEPQEEFIDLPLLGNLVFKYPKEGDLTTSQKSWASTHFLAAENALFNVDFADLTNGYRAFLELPSFWTYHVLQEWCYQQEISFASIYFYKHRGQKINAGPLWDFDLSFGNSVAYNGTAPYVVPTNPWFGRLMQDPYYVAGFKARCKELIPILNAAIGDVKKHAEVLKGYGAFDREYAKWGYYTHPGGWTYVPSPTPANYNEWLDYMLNFATRRALLLEQKETWPISKPAMVV